MRLLIMIIGVLALVSPLNVSAEGINAGFVQGLWYSEDPFFADEEVRIYAALRNNAPGDLTGTVRFIANDAVIGEVEVSALSGTVVDTWTDWTPEYGEHRIEAVLTDAHLDGTDVDIENATVTYPLAEDTRFVDRDTDGDGIGNEEDPDDDGDGISDDEETAAGTDPLVFNEPEEETTEPDDVEGAAADEPDTDVDSETPVGLETFLGEGIARNALEQVTDVSNTIKKNIDAYRDERAERKHERSATTTDTSTAPQQEGAPGDAQSASGSPVGEITRTTTSTADRIDIKGVFLSVFDGVYTFFLWLLSLYFAYPGIVQFTLLILILAALYRTAKKLASRPQD